MDYPKVMQFDSGADERETQINIDHFSHNIELFTSNNTVYRRLIRKGLKPHKVDKGGAIFIEKFDNMGKILQTGILKAE
ncbi:hypothetical protein [Culicoidibacter larvae]|uniref:Uncharacterized protein n=1 Tax=Culicoidibacter larvae TaxID=2579976 RepID=A0A5R8Q9H5_9FIRM|nr:hypothetical protein [Culicoidibacter larvae]TLG72073.1 hypothetical protein FEZ08_09580 [Culicoidibacter larvae]